MDSARLLHKHGLSPAFAGGEAPREEPVPSRLFSEFALEAHRLSGIQEFGLEAGSKTGVHSIGDLGRILEQSFTVHALILKLAELMPLINSGSETWFEPGRSPGSHRFCHRQLLKAGHAQIDGYALPIFIDGVRLGAGFAWRPKWIALHRKAGAPESREALSNADIASEVDYFAFEIPKRVLCLKLPFAESPRGDNEAESRFRGQSPPETLPDALEHSIRAGFGVRMPTVEESAHLAGVSARTLRRVLRADYDTSFRKIVEQTRMREAFFLLSQCDLCLKEIAHHLGYSGNDNFTHAFRRWTGRTPSDYRDPARTER